MTELVRRLLMFNPPPNTLKVYTGLNEYCAAEYEHITEGVLLSDLLTDNTSSPQNTFDLNLKYVGVGFATLYKWFIGGQIQGNIWVTESEALKPMISLESAIRDVRPCYRDLIMGAEYGQDVLAVLAKTDKQRFWPKAVVSRIGDRFKLFVHDDTTPSHMKARIVTVNVNKLKDTLLMVEEAYEIQTKQGIVDGNMPLTEDLKQSLIKSNALRSLIGTEEFQVATLIAQKLKPSTSKYNKETKK